MRKTLKKLRIKLMLISMLGILLCLTGCDNNNNIEQSTDSSSVQPEEDVISEETESQSMETEDFEPEEIIEEEPVADIIEETESQDLFSNYCEVEGCMNEGTESYPGISGETEWYCQEHYDEMMDIIGMMEEDVGSGTASKHTCEACSKEGTYSIVGLSGETEYYCTEHYNEMVDILEMLIGE